MVSKQSLISSFFHSGLPSNVLQSSVLALDDSALDVDQVDNLIKFCPTKEEMELLKVCSLCFETLPSVNFESSLRWWAIKGLFGII